ncbi:hypothetical protein OE810_05150 [Rhodobacteraceae bacterium XHP0102]|nr:hypothetical protein [Rhodobacteraceae bacterium XHP0102]
MNRLISSVLRTVVLGVIWRGIDKATDHFAKRRAQNGQNDPAKTRQAQNRMRQTTRMLRRFTRF